MQVDGRRESFLKLTIRQLIGQRVGLYLMSHLLRLFLITLPVLPCFAREFLQLQQLLLVSLTGYSVVVLRLADAGDGLQAIKERYAQRGSQILTHIVFELVAERGCRLGMKRLKIGSVQARVQRERGKK